MDCSIKKHQLFIDAVNDEEVLLCTKVFPLDEKVYEMIVHLLLAYLNVNDNSNMNKVAKALSNSPKENDNMMLVVGNFYIDIFMFKILGNKPYSELFPYFIERDNVLKDKVEKFRNFLIRKEIIKC